MRIIKTVCVLLVTTLVAASCIKSDDDVTYYNDAAISSFTLGTLNRYLHTTSSTGADSIYKTTVTGSDYKMSIDRLNHRIYNLDSLPLGTDISRVVCSVTAYNNGLIAIRSTTSDSLFYYSTTDSIDFTTDREFVVYSSDGANVQSDVVTLNVHQQEGEEFHWVLTEQDWTPPTTEAVTLPAGIQTLLGGTEAEQYALSDDHLLMVSRDGGASWSEDELDEDATLLPTDDLSLVSYPMNMTPNTDYVLLAGRREVEELDAAGNTVKVWRSSVWRKIVDNDETAAQGRWAYMDRSAGALYQLPAIENLTLLHYDDGVLAIGKPYTQIYQTRDNGITWKTNSLYQMPDGFDSSATAVTATVDDDQYIWLYCAGTGQVWRGRLNRLGWKQ